MATNLCAHTWLGKRYESCQNTHLLLALLFFLRLFILILHHHQFAFFSLTFLPNLPPMLSYYRYSLLTQMLMMINRSADTKILRQSGPIIFICNAARKKNNSIYGWACVLLSTTLLSEILLYLSIFSSSTNFFSHCIILAFKKFVKRLHCIFYCMVVASGKYSNWNDGYWWYLRKWVESKNLKI